MNELLKILLIDNDHSSCAFLRNALLEKAKIDYAPSFHGARDFLLGEKYDFVFFEPLLEGETGYQFLSEVRREGILNNARVFALSNGLGVQTEIQAHQNDVDEYVQKSTVPELVRAKVDKHSRTIKNDNKTTLNFGDIEIDMGTLVVTMGEGEETREVSLTSKEFQILVSLVKNAGEVLTRDDLYSIIWNKKNSQIQRTLDMHVSSLRKKLGVSGQYIKTIRSSGYKIELSA